MWMSERISKLVQTCGFKAVLCMSFYSLHIRLENPCSGNQDCEGPYNYRHFLSLTNDSASFTVSEAVVCMTV